MSMSKEVPFETHTHNIAQEAKLRKLAFETTNTHAQGSPFAALDLFRRYLALHRPLGAIGLDAEP